MNKKFLQTIHNLQQNNITILRDRRSMAHKEFLAQLTQGYKHIDLSLPMLSSLARRAAENFVAQLPLPVYLQNLQYAPQLLKLLAEQKVSCTQVLASCTQSFALEKFAEQLQNVQFVDLPLEDKSIDTKRHSFAQVRAAYACGRDNLSPLSLEEEYLQRLSARQPVDVISALWQGERSSYGGDYGEYLQKVLQADIMFLTTVSDSEKFYTFMQAAAAQTGEVVNFSKLAQAASITPPTAKTWLQFLLGTGIVYLLEPVQHIGLKRLVSTKKLYFRDTGLACALLNLQNAQDVAQSEHLAQLEQNYMLNKIRESYINKGLVPDLRFYRDNNKKNIDLILLRDNVLFPMMLAHEELDAERVAFAFDVLAEYAAKHDYKIGNGAMVYPVCATQEVLKNLWQVSAEQL